MNQLKHVSLLKQEELLSELPNKHGTSAASNPPPDNRQARQKREDKKNGKSTASSATSIAAAEFLPLLLKNMVFIAKKFPARREHSESPFVRIIM